MSKKSEKLFQEFPPVDTQQWEAVIEKDLKGADYEKKLVWSSPSNIRVKPYFRQEDMVKIPDPGLPGQFPYTRGKNSSNNSWKIRQNHTFLDATSSGKKLLDMFKRGMQSVELKGTTAIAADELIRLFEVLHGTKLEINFRGFDPFQVLEAMDKSCATGAIQPEAIIGGLGVDPLEGLILTGKLGDEESQFDELAKVFERAQLYPGLRVMRIQASHFHNAGSTAIQALGFSLGMANECILEMLSRGLSIEQVAPKMGFSFAVGSNYFFELAKFRSTRKLWAQMIQSYEPNKLELTQSYIHAETSLWNKTIYDPHVNMLRTTTEAMSAVIGGIDSLTVHPFDESYQEPGEFSERIARNQQLILREEAYLDKVVDPAAGSYYVEYLTDSIASEAWKLFQEVERLGGFTEAFLEGFIQDTITTIAQIRDLRIAHQQEILLGTNQYPNGAEMIGTDKDFEKIWPKIVDPTGADTQPLIPYRGAEGFEKIRMQTEAAKKRPKVFLLTIGNLNMRKARAAFSTSFFEAAGYEIVDHIGFNSIQEGVAAAKAIQADVVVLCSSDDEYPNFAKELIQSEIQSELVIAGYPQAHVETLKEMGYSHFIHVRSNLLETLRLFNQLLGIAY